MQIESAQDRLETFFLTDDFASDCVLTGPDDFTQTIQVIQSALTDRVEVYDTNIEAASENFICRLEDLAAVDRRRLKQYQAQLGGITYQLERVSNDQDGLILTVYLNKLNG